MCSYVWGLRVSVCMLTSEAFLHHFPSDLLGRVSPWNAEFFGAASRVSLLALGFPHLCLWNAAITGWPPCPQWHLLLRVGSELQLSCLLGQAVHLLMYLPSSSVYSLSLTVAWEVSNVAALTSPKGEKPICRHSWYIKRDSLPPWFSLLVV